MVFTHDLIKNMTNQEKFVNLFNEMGLAPTITSVDYKEYKHTVLTLETGQPKVVGYSCSFVEFVFTPTGEFVEVGVWE